MCKRRDEKTEKMFQHDKIERWNDALMWWDEMRRSRSCFYSHKKSTFTSLPPLFFLSSSCLLKNSWFLGLKEWKESKVVSLVCIKFFVPSLHSSYIKFHVYTNLPGWFNKISEISIVLHVYIFQESGNWMRKWTCYAFFTWVKIMHVFSNHNTYNNVYNIITHKVKAITNFPGWKTY
jgi:hypothetical protein